MKKSEESGENLGYPKMIILNACSPSKLLQKKGLIKQIYLMRRMMNYIEE